MSLTDKTTKTKSHDLAQLFVLSWNIFELNQTKLLVKLGHSLQPILY